MNQNILIKLLNDKSIYNKIITEFPNLYSSCLIIKQNVSSEAITLSIEKILNFYKTNKKFQLFIDFIKENLNVSELNGNDVTGTIIILDKKEESFKKLMEVAKKEQWQYKGIAIVDQFDSIRLYFY